MCNILRRFNPDDALNVRIYKIHRECICINHFIINVIIICVLFVLFVTHSTDHNYRRFYTSYCSVLSFMCFTVSVGVSALQSAHECCRVVLFGTQPENLKTGKAVNEWNLSLWNQIQTSFKQTWLNGVCVFSL